MKLITILFLVLNSINLIHSQNLKAKITYRANLNTNSYLERLNKDTLMPTFRKEHWVKRAKDAVPTNFHLMFNGKESLYKAEYDLMTSKRLGLLMNQTASVGRQDFVYYTNIETKEKFYQSFLTKEILVDLSSVNWKLTQEIKKIGNYTCYKAIADLDSQNIPQMKLIGPVVAWYTPEIPTPFGIQNFNGLPGLTLELIAEYDKGKIFYTATKIELNPEEEIKIKKPKGKNVSEQEYIALIERLNNARKGQRQ